MGSSTLSLKHFLQRSGLGARRKVDEMIGQGRIMVNGQVITQYAYPVDPDRDQVSLDGQILQGFDTKLYYLFHKPRGIITTVTDPQGRETVIDYLREHHGIHDYLFPVGRLDLDTQGLLILTNDGVFSQIILHPRYGTEKVYHALVRGRPGKDAIQRLRDGIEIDGEKTAPAKVWIAGDEKEMTLLEITLHEGKKRQIRLMCRAIGHFVIRLKRIRIGDFDLRGIEKPGQLRLITPEEIQNVKKRIDSGIRLHMKEK